MRIDRLPAKLIDWPEDLRLKYNELKALEKKTKEPLRDWNSAGAQQAPQRTVPGGRGPMDRGRGGDTMQQEPARGPLGR